MRKKSAAFVAALIVSSTFAIADQVVFKNGDKVTGTITGLADGKLAITTAEAGDVKYDAAQINSFSTDAPVKLQLTDGTLLDQKVELEGAGLIQVEGGLLGKQRVSIADISTINAPPAVWTGDVKFGGLLSRGNTDSESINFGVDLERKTVQDDLSFNAGYLWGYTKDRTTGVKTATADNWQGDLKYSFNFTRKLYGYVDGQVSRDRLAFLDLRFNPSLGLGYRLVEKPDFTFTPEGGIAWVYEHYTNGSPTREDFSLKLSYHLTKKFNDKVSLYNDLDYYPSVQNGRNFIADIDLGVRATLTAHFFSEFKVVLDYDSNPAIDAEKFNTRYELNLGYNL